jgi:hypothetical protein
VGLPVRENSIPFLQYNARVWTETEITVAVARERLIHFTAEGAAMDVFNKHTCQYGMGSMSD